MDIKIFLAAFMLLITSDSLASGMNQALAEELLLVDNFGNRVHFRYDGDRVECLDFSLTAKLKTDFDCHLLADVQEPDLQSLQLFQTDARSIHHKIIIPFFRLRGGKDGEYELILSFKDGLIEQAFIQNKGAYPDTPIKCLTGKCD